ncbi:MAG: hypothetical protein V3V05_07780 [Pontiella sp.]
MAFRAVRTAGVAQSSFAHERHARSANGVRRVGQAVYHCAACDVNVSGMFFLLSDADEIMADLLMKREYKFNSRIIYRGVHIAENLASNQVG